MRFIHHDAEVADGTLQWSSHFLLSSTAIADTRNRDAAEGVCYNDVAEYLWVTDSRAVQGVSHLFVEAVANGL